MDYISPKDVYEIRIASLVSNVDKDVIIELYQPLIGSLASVLYLTLLKQKRNEEDDSIVFTHEQLLSLTQVSSGNLLTARHALEGVGLLRTYLKEFEGERYYIYMLYAPKTPKEFFDDVLFKGLMIQAIGEKETKRLAMHYRVDLVIPEEFKEISASFVDVFNPNYDDASFRKNINSSIVGHESGRVKISFNYDLFFKYIETNSQIITSSFLKRELKEVERLAALFGLDEKTMAVIVIDEYRGDKTPHLDFASIAERAKEQIRYPHLQSKVASKKSQVSGDGILVQKIHLMEKTSPADWLKLLQNNTKVASSDLDIVNNLSSDYGFSNGVINAITDYVLTKNDNILSKKYCEKIASSLARERVETAIDAMNYLNKISLGNKSKKHIPVKKIEESTKPEPSQSTISDEEMEDIFSMFDKKGGK